jgi:hypothetical protein
MSTFTQFTGGRVLAAVHNYFSGGGVSIAGVVNYGQKAGKNYATTSQTANTLRDILNVTGRGVLNFVAVHSTDATGKTLRLKITIDGAVVFDATSATVYGNGYGVIAIGTLADGASVALQPLRFVASCRVEMASSVASDTAATTIINYEVDA